MSLPNAGSKGDICGEHDFEADKGKVEGYGGVLGQDGDVYKRTEGVEHGDGPTKYTTKVEPPAAPPRPRTRRLPG